MFPKPFCNVTPQDIGYNIWKHRAHQIWLFLVTSVLFFFFLKNFVRWYFVGSAYGPRFEVHWRSARKLPLWSRIKSKTRSDPHYAYDTRHTRFFFCSNSDPPIGLRRLPYGYDSETTSTIFYHLTRVLQRSPSLRFFPSILPSAEISNSNPARFCFCSNSTRRSVCGDFLVSLWPRLWNYTYDLPLSAYLRFFPSSNSDPSSSLETRPIGSFRLFCTLFRIDFFSSDAPKPILVRRQ